MTADDRYTGPDVTIEVRNLWKIFGAAEQEVLEAVRTSALTKAEIQNRFGCILGVENVSFDVRCGEIFCIMGLSGSGKSTLLRHLNQLIEPSAGQVRILGRNVQEMDRKALRNLRATQTGMVFQHMALMPHWTVRQNVGFPLKIQNISCSAAWDTTEKVLDLVGLDAFSDYMPDQLSGGMKQRVGLARALAADPPILLMDEPFSALDPLIRRQLQDLFIRLSRELGKTAVFITHDLDEAIRIGDRIAIMKDGRVVQCGEAREIVFEPADDYVRDFVQDLSRIKFLKLTDIMRPLTGDIDPGTYSLTLPQDLPVSQAIPHILGHQGPVWVGPEPPAPALGYFTKDDLLEALL